MPICQFCLKTIDNEFKIHNGEFSHIECFVENIGYKDGEIGKGNRTKYKYNGYGLKERFIFKRRRNKHESMETRKE